MDQGFSEKLQKIENILHNSLPASYSAEWKSDSFGTIADCISDMHLDVLQAPCRNLLNLGGKRWRPLLLVLCAEMTGRQNSKSKENQEKLIDNAYHLTPLVEFCHTASLIHDDIEDNADMRRGKPAAHITFGIDTAINAGSWLYFEAPVCINSLNVSDDLKIKLYKLYMQELRRLHLGQAMDILWHRSPELIPSIDEYKAMVQSKTGTLASLAAQIGVAAAEGSSENVVKAGKIAADIGIGFQIIDDVQNLTTGNPGKLRGDDIVENKKSLPVLLHLKEFPEDKEKISELMAAAAKDGISSPAVEECISILHKGGQIKKAFEQGLELIKSKSMQLASLYPDSEPSKDILQLFDSMISRVR